MTNWTGVWTKLGWGMDKFGLRYGQFWVGVWTIWTGVWTKLDYPMYRFLHICKESVMNSGFDVAFTSFAMSLVFQ